MQTPPPRQPNRRFAMYTPIFAVPRIPGLCGAQLCRTLSFEGLYYSFLLLWGLHSPARHHCPICGPMWSFSVPFLGVGQS